MLDSLANIKYQIKLVQEKCTDHGNWDRWARRFISGIDKTHVAAHQSLVENDAKLGNLTPLDHHKALARSLASALAELWSNCQKNNKQFPEDRYKQYENSISNETELVELYTLSPTP